jgi:hypothetical protein
MSSTESTRALLGPADPARGVRVPEPRLPAMALIDRATTTTAFDDVRPSAPRRAVRFALPAATAAAAAATVAVVVLVPGGAGDSTRDPRAGTNPPTTSAPEHSARGLVVTPVAYAIADNPPSASAELRALARRIGDAPYDSRTGRYAYVRTKTWGDPQMSSEDGKYSVGYTHEDEKWQSAVRPGVQSTTMLPYEFPDEASRDHFKDMPPPDKQPSLMTIDAVGEVPAGRVRLARQLYAGHGPIGIAKAVDAVYSRYPLARANRAMVLDILADEPAFRWRGEVTDRAGRKGVAITGDEQGARVVLIFDPATGALLASEHVFLRPPTPILGAYAVFLSYDRRNDAPQVPATPGNGPTREPGAKPAG